MQVITSADNTAIAFWRSGAGPPLLLVHGVIASHQTTWRLVLPMLEQRYTVYAMDRRGRGGSSDSGEYDLQREAEDVRAVLDAIDQPTRVLGHSYGGLCALEAALLAPNVDRLVLYESVPLRGSDRYSPELIDRLEALLAAGDIEGSLVAMLREVAGLAPVEIDMLRAQTDAWAARLANTPAMPRELRAEQRYAFAADRFATLPVPVLLLVGGNSPSHELYDAQAIAAALSDARVRVLPGQQHLAMHTAPGMFVAEIVQFLTY